MNPWYYVWTTVFAIATIAFGVIAVIVVIFGFSDLKTMLQGFETDAVKSSGRGDQSHEL